MAIIAGTVDYAIRSNPLGACSRVVHVVLPRSLSRAWFLAEPMLSLGSSYSSDHGSTLDEFLALHQLASTAQRQAVMTPSAGCDLNFDDLCEDALIYERVTLYNEHESCWDERRMNIYYPMVSWVAEQPGLRTVPVHQWGGSYEGFLVDLGGAMVTADTMKRMLAAVGQC